MARIPGVRYLQSPASMPRMNNAGEAIGRATEQLGQTISGVSDIGFKYAGKLRQMKDAEGQSAFLTQMDSRATEFENGLITSQNPSGWTDEWKSNVNSWGQQIDDLDISDSAKANLKLKYNEWASAKGDRLSTTAALKSVETTKGTIANNLNYYGSRGDQMGYDRTVEEMKGTGIFNDAQIEAARMEGERRLTEFNIKEGIVTDPFGTLEQLERDTFLDENPGATKELQIWGIGKAKEGIRMNQSMTVRDISTQIDTGDIKTLDDLNAAIEKKGKSVDETTANKLRFHFGQSEAVSPDVKFGVVDNLNRLYDSFEKGEINEEEYRVAHGLVAQRVDEFGARPGVGPLRSQVDKMDPASWDGRKLQQSAQEARMRSVQKLGKTFEDQGAFGQISDEEKENLTPYERSVKQTQIYEDRDKVERAMETWLSKEENQNADEEAISTQFKKTYMQQTSARILRPKGAWATQSEVGDYLQSSTGSKAMEGDRITSYGYANDTTPDSNSSAGIGAWVSDAEAERIRAGEQTPNRLRTGDLAVSRDVERRFRAIGISPGDDVTIKLDDGTTQTGRWMDRTAESYNGKKLTGRFDLYSPDGESPLNGKKVVDWWKPGMEIIHDPRNSYVPVPTQVPGIKAVIDNTAVPLDRKKPSLNKGEFSEYNVIETNGDDS